MGLPRVDTPWTGMSARREGENFECYNVHGVEEPYAVSEQVQKGAFEPHGERVVQSGGQVTYNVPPLKTSAGLRNEFYSPNSNPISHGQRDASYAYDDYHLPCNAGSVYPPPMEPTQEDPFLSDRLPIQQYYALGQHDLQSLFADYFDDEYVEQMYTASMAITLGAACKDDPFQSQQYRAIVDDASPESHYFDQYMASVSIAYMQTQQSEEWSPAEHAVTTYQCKNMVTEAQPTIEDHNEVDEPELIMAVDNKGRIAPMASGIMVVRDVQGKACSRLLRVLFDSGGAKSMCHRRVMPKGARINTNGGRVLMQTIAGTYAPVGTAEMTGIRLPAFDKNRVVKEHNFQVFQGDCRYDVILGSDFLTKVGMKLDYEKLEIEWLGNTVPMESLKPAMVAAHVGEYIAQIEVDDMGVDVDSYLAAPIKDAKYERLDVEAVLKEHCSHLSPTQQGDLRVLLRKHEKLFDGTLGKYPGAPMHIELEEGARPVYRRPYPVPQVHLKTFKKELDHLVAMGVLSPARDTEWGLPTFIIPKKDGRVRWVSDMRELNKVIKRTQYTLPIIQDVLRKRQGYEFLTKLDISMQYYTFELDEASKRLCTIVTPFGPYSYNRVPMGLKISPGYAQARMEEVLRGIDEMDVYIDDIGIFTSNWNRHIEVLGEVLYRLEKAGFTINPLKCEWGVQETDWLGYWLTPIGLKPWAKKVDAILKLQRPRTATELRTFLGMVTYYRDMWPRRSHILGPLTALAHLPKKAVINWTPELETAFKQMKAIIAEDCLMAYPDHNKSFEIYTDASDYQLGACIMQGGRPVAYYSRKLSSAQRNYTTMEKELLAIVMVLLEYRTMLLGAELNIYTDHRNLTFSNFNTQRVLRWRCFVEEYSPNLCYLEGKLNVLADAFSRLPRFDDATAVEGKNPGSSVTPEPLEAYHASHEPGLYDCVKHHPDLENYFDSFLNLPHKEENPLSYQWLRETQEGDSILMKRGEGNDPKFHMRKFGDVELVCTGRAEKEDWKICLTNEAIDHAIEWFHQVLNHPGKQRLLDGMARYHHPHLRQRIDALKCDACQRHKVDGKSYGQLPPRDVRAAPWEQVDVDLIGPWTIPCVSGAEYTFSALTCIDRVTGLAELIRINDKTSMHVTTKFEECWLARYPRPMACCHDNGGEFTGWEFQQCLADFGIKDVPTTSRNPTGNAICERMHQTVGNVLRTLVHENRPRTLKHAQILIDRALSTCLHAVRSNVSQVTGYSPGALAFHRDMFLDVPLIADLLAIRDRRQLAVDANLRRVNSKRTSYDYQPGQTVLKERHEWTKLGERWDGPFKIEKVHVNGNVTIALRGGVTERIHIRRVKPYHDPTFTTSPRPVHPES